MGSDAIKELVLTKEELADLQTFCKLNKLEIDDVIASAFRQGYRIEKYGLLGTPGVVQEKIIEKEVIVEKRIEVPVEVIIEKPVIQYVEVEKEIIKEIPVDRVVEKIVEVTKEVPVEKVVIKEVIKEIPIEKVVEKEIFITDDNQVNELLSKIQHLESDKQIFSTKTQELEEEVRKFSTITTENENIFHYKMSKKEQELDELRHSLDILRQTPPVEKIVEVVIEKPVDDSKSQKLQETLAKLRQDILDKDKKINDLELKISELMGLQQEKKALYLKGSNLDDKLYK